MTKTLAAILLVSTTFATQADDDLTRYIAERAASCWASPVAMRGISFSADYEVAFTHEGHVSAIKVVAVVPATQTIRAVADDLAAAFEQCGPYTTEGMREMSLRVSWPM